MEHKLKRYQAIQLVVLYPQRLDKKEHLRD